MNGTDNRPQWVREFGEDWAVPDVIAHDPALFDQSWHNDAMPIFCLAVDADKDREDVPFLSCDHVDPAQSEFADEPSHQRFCVWRVGVNGADQQILYRGEDAAAAVAALKAAPEGGAK